ncbi:MAG: replication initiator protein A [Clostridiales bacterium]|nr:replication initiator protein A [Clostridiales bacterium]
MNNFFTNENQLTSYIAYPKYLFGNKLSETTKLIYIVLLDRAKMSLKNSSYTDSTGVFVYFPINKMAEAVNKSEMTVKNAYSALEKADLIHRKHQGVGRPNKIYVKLPVADSFVSEENIPVRQTENSLSDGQDFVRLADKKVSGNKTINKTSLIKQESKTGTAYGSQKNVFLTDEEYSALVDEFSIAEIEDYIERVSSYMVRRNTNYNSHSATIRRWILEDRQKKNKTSDRVYERKAGESL